MPLFYQYTHHPSEHLATNDHFTVSIVVPFSERPINVLMQYIAFLDWFLALHLRFINTMA